MKKAFLSFIVTTVFAGASLFITAPVHAQSLDVTSIGGISTGGSLTTWTHEGYNPLLVGTASPSATVSIDIDSVVESTTAATNGSWQYKPTVLDSLGSYEVAVSSGSESVLFTLTIAKAASSSTTTDDEASSSVVVPDELPQTGSDDIIFLLAGGIFLIFTGAYAGAHMMGYFSEV